MAKKKMPGPRGGAYGGKLLGGDALCTRCIGDRPVIGKSKLENCVGCDRPTVFRFSPAARPAPEPK